MKTPCPTPNSFFTLRATLVSAAGIFLAAVGAGVVHAQPANDLFANARILTGANGQVSDSTFGAGKEPGEPNHAGDPGGLSIWYSWSAPASGPVVFDTVGSGFDTLLAVYTGASVDALTLVVQNDDFGFGVQSRVAFDALQDQVYRITIDGYGGESGPTRLNWASSSPPNDNFAAAQVLSGQSGTVNGSTEFATKEPGEPNHAANPGGHYIWYSWTAPSNGPVVFDTVGSGFDTLLAVYTGSDLQSLILQVENDDINLFDGILTSRVFLDAVQDEVYWIAIDDKGGDRATTVLNWAACCGVGVPSIVLYETGWETAPASPAWTPGNIIPQNGWLSDPPVSNDRNKVVVNGTADANPFGSPVATPYGNQFHRFRASASTSVNNYQYVWPALFAAFAARPPAYDILSGSIDIFVPSGDSADASVYGLMGFDEYIDGIYLDYGFLIVPNARRIQLVIDGSVERESVTNFFPYNTWFNVAIQVNYQTGDVLVLYNGTPVPGFATRFEFIPSSTLTDLDLYCENSINPPTSRIIFTDNYRVAVNLLSPPNDNFADADAFPLTGVIGQIGGSNRGATAEPDEPDHALLVATASVWYTWMAPRSGQFVFDTSGSALNTVLAIYTGDALGQLNEVGSNDDIGGGIVQSSVSFTATDGAVYHIAVDGAGGEWNNFILSWQPLPLNDNFVDAFLLTGVSGQTNGYNRGATAEADEPAHALQVASASVWYSWMAPQNGQLVFDTKGSALNTVLAIYTGDALDRLNEVASNNDIGGGILQSRVSFTATEGAVYRLALDGAGGARNNFILRWQPLPLNDSFVEAFLLTGVSGQTNGSNRGATTELGEPNHAGTAGGSSIWYSWTAPASGPVAFDTLGSGFDTLLAVYTGSDLASLTVQAQNNNFFNGILTSRVIFDAVQDEVYRIAIDGYRGADGPTVLNWVSGAPPNDNFLSAQVLSGQSGTVTGTTFLASKELNEPDHAFDSGGHSIWYEWPMTLEGLATIDLAGSTFDTLLAVYTGESVDALTQVAQNDDFGFGLQSRVQFFSEPGVTYRIAVDGYGGAQGPVTLSYSNTITPLVITAQPRSRDAVVGEQVEFRVTVAGFPAHYQWYRNEAAVPGATRATLLFTNVLGFHAGDYTVVITNDLYAVTSVVARLTVRTEVRQVWQDRVRGSQFPNDQSVVIKVDSQGNAYFTGSSYGSSYNDYLTRKYSPDGSLLWSARYNGPGNGNDDSRALAVDSDGNVYVTGDSYGGPATGFNIATVKYDSDGNQLWDALRNGSANGEDVGLAVTVDGSGNVYVIGYVTSVGSGLDYATVKYAPNGNLLWLARYNGPGNGTDVGEAIAVDNDGNVYVTGYSYGGSATTNDYATIKYGPSGTQLWVARYNGPGNGIDIPFAIAVDNAGNAHVTGRSFGSGTASDYATIKYATNGTQLWLARYNGPGNGTDFAFDLKLDSAGNVYVTGQSFGSTAISFDYGTVKYGPNGNQLWAARYNGPANDNDFAFGLALDSIGNVYVTGGSYGGAFTTNDIATVKYSTNGTQLWAARYDGPAHLEDHGRAIAVDSTGGVYVAGESAASGADEYVILKYLSNARPMVALTSPTNNSTFILPATIDFTVTTSDSEGPIVKVELFDFANKIGESFEPPFTIAWTNPPPGSHRMVARAADQFGATATSPAVFVSVLVVNHPPVIASIPVQAVDEGTPLAMSIPATDPDVPPNNLTFSLAPAAPAGATINSTNGFFTWTPTEEQGPGTNTIQVIVTDDGSPSLRATQIVTVVIHEVNAAPMFLPVPNQTAYVLSPLRVTNAVIDPDLPANRMTFQLLAGAPTGARIHPSRGVFSWAPGRAQAASSNFITVIVTDDGDPPLSATNNFSVLVSDYLELTLGATVLRAGQSGSVPVTMTSSAGVTNLSFLLEAPEGRATNFVLEMLSPDVSGSLEPSAPNRSFIHYNAAAGQSLIGARPLGRLDFTTSSNQTSAIIPLNISSLAAVQSNGAPMPRTIAKATASGP